ncbi:alpha/beta hydrolase [Fulvimarina sp. MAC3]|uniref:alpha/beta fold hydrolase n=1 Tax=Fulvimarina sp. MAC3 TaxID=3148887 RepID=UPI0031FDC408
MLDIVDVPQSRQAQSLSRSGFHQIAYRDWGRETDKRPLMCIHGLTRNSHDFDDLAARACIDRRVVTPDIVGRGRSEWLADPADYNLLQYNVDMTVVAADAGISRYDWIGNSLGGLIGMSLAGVENSPISRLVVNDIAPEIPFSALRRVSSYIADRTFPNIAVAEAHLRESLAPFGPMTDDNWRHLARTSVIPEGDGYRLAFDPGIFENFRRYWLIVHFSLWKYWEQIKCPVLILRGENSDFLTPNLLDKMVSRLPHADVIEFPGVGHTPTLNAPEQIEPVLDWLNSDLI